MRFKTIFKKIKTDLISFPLEWLVVLSLYISQIYYSYRYIFKINATETSPTYSSTGVNEKVIKYIITLAFFFIFIIIILLKKEYIKTFKDRFKNDQYLKYILISIGVLLIYSFCNLYFYHHFNVFILNTVSVLDFLVKFLIFVPFTFIILFVNKKNFYSKWNIFIIISFIYQLIYTLIEVFLYLIYHRLPALAYVNSSVRFGGGWDDPNAISIFYILFIVYIFWANNIKPLYKYILIILTLFLLFLAFSFTAFILLFISVIITLVAKKKYKSVAIVILISLISIIIFSFTPSAYKVIKYKIPSAVQHIRQITGIEKYITSTTTKELLIGSNKTVFTENFYYQIFYNLGSIAILLFSLIFYIVFYRKYKQKHIIGYEYIFIIVFLIGLIGLPLFEFYPINIYFWVIIGMLFL